MLCFLLTEFQPMIPSNVIEIKPQLQSDDSFPDEKPSVILQPGTPPAASQPHDTSQQSPCHVPSQSTEQHHSTSYMQAEPHQPTNYLQSGSHPQHRPTNYPQSDSYPQANLQVMPPGYPYPPSNQYQQAQSYLQPSLPESQKVQLAALRQQVLQEHSLLLEWLLRLSFTGGQQAQIVQQITACYNQAIHIFQQDMNQSLVTILDPTKRDELEIKWLPQRLNITRMTSQDLQMLVTRGVPPAWLRTPHIMSTDPTAVPEPSRHTTSPAQPILDNLVSGRHSYSPVYSPSSVPSPAPNAYSPLPHVFSPNDGAQSPLSTFSNDQSSSSDSDISSDQGSDSASDISSRHNRLLSGHAKKTLKAWYQQNHTYPYLTPDMTRTLASQAGITMDQVRKWFSNRRLRGKNTYLQKGLVNPLHYHSQSKKQSSPQQSPGGVGSKAEACYLSDLSNIQIAGVYSLAPIPMK